MPSSGQPTGHFLCREPLSLPILARRPPSGHPQAPGSSLFPQGTWLGVGLVSVAPKGKGERRGRGLSRSPAHHGARSRRVRVGGEGGHVTGRKSRSVLAGLSHVTWGGGLCPSVPPSPSFHRRRLREQHWQTSSPHLLLSDPTQESNGPPLASSVPLQWRSVDSRSAVSLR